MFLTAVVIIGSKDGISWRQRRELNPSFSVFELRYLIDLCAHTDQCWYLPVFLKRGDG